MSLCKPLLGADLIFRFKKKKNLILNRKTCKIDGV